MSRPLGPSDIDRLVKPVFYSRSALSPSNFLLILDLHLIATVLALYISPWRSGIPWESLSLLPSALSCLYVFLGWSLLGLV